MRKECGIYPREADAAKWEENFLCVTWNVLKGFWATFFLHSKLIKKQKQIWINTFDFTQRLHGGELYKMRILYLFFWQLCQEKTAWLWPWATSTASTGWPSRWIHQCCLSSVPESQYQQTDRHLQQAQSHPGRPKQGTFITWDRRDSNQSTAKNKSGFYFWTRVHPKDHETEHVSQTCDLWLEVKICAVNRYRQSSVWQMCTYEAAITKQLSNLLVGGDIRGWWAGVRTRPCEVLCEVVTGVNPWISLQHPHGLLSLKCVGTHTSRSLEVGDRGPRWRLSFHYWGLAKHKGMTALGTIFSVVSPSSCEKSGFSRRLRLSGFRGKHRRLQTNKMAICRSSVCRVLIFPQLLPSRRGNDGLCQGYWAWLWLVRRLSTISIKTATAAGLITGLKEDPDEKTMSPLHSWVGGLPTPM